MKLNYYVKDNKKIYTLKSKINNKTTQPAHYKFLKLKDVQDKIKTN